MMKPLNRRLIALGIAALAVFVAITILTLLAAMSGCASIHIKDEDIMCMHRCERIIGRNQLSTADGGDCVCVDVDTGAVKRIKRYDVPSVTTFASYFLRLRSRL